MNRIISGHMTHPLPAGPDGNLGYSLSFDYKFLEDNPTESMEYSNIEFSGPGSWEGFNQGDDSYPLNDMLILVQNNYFKKIVDELFDELNIEPGTNYKADLIREYFSVKS
ncbi:MAG: hypothetical protein IMF09_08590 [Proteobacteria bacterium]|nr:hypothetical protein [Pseudomonadota bacterium]